MDPDANLEEMRQIAAAIVASDDPPEPNDAMRLAELVQALDEWIVKGGFLPAAWRRPALDAHVVTEWSDRNRVTLGVTMVSGQMFLRVQPKTVGSKLLAARVYASTTGDQDVSVDALIARAMRDLP